MGNDIDSQKAKNKPKKRPNFYLQEENFDSQAKDDLRSNKKRLIINYNILNSENSSDINDISFNAFEESDKQKLKEKNDKYLDPKKDLLKNINNTTDLIHQNAEKILKRNENIENLKEKAKILQNSSLNFEKNISKIKVKHHLNLNNNLSLEKEETLSFNKVEEFNELINNNLNILNDNLEKLSKRGKNIENLNNKSNGLKNASLDFKKNAVKIKYEYKKKKNPIVFKIIMFIVFLMTELILIKKFINNEKLMKKIIYSSSAFLIFLTFTLMINYLDKILNFFQKYDKLNTLIEHFEIKEIKIPKDELKIH